MSTTTIESSPNGSNAQLSGFAPLGVTYDRHDERADIMLGDGVAS